MDILNKYVPVMLSVLCLSGCYTDFEPDIDSSPVLCVNSLITADEPVAVYVTHTWRYSLGYNGVERDVRVADAEVELIVNGCYADNLTYTEADGRYHSDFIPVQGDTVELQVRNPVYGSAEAKVVVPLSVPIDSVAWNAMAYNLSGEYYGNGGFSVDFSFDLDLKAYITDPSATDNYFKLAWQPVAAYDDEGIYGTNGIIGGFSMGSFDYEAEPLFAEHISVLESVLGSDSYGFTAFSDRQFSGRTYPLRLHFSNGKLWLKSYENYWQFCDIGVILSLENISASYYNWLIYDWQEYDGLLGSLGGAGFADGLMGYSNVSTGAGVVAARSVSTYKVDLAKFVSEQIDQIIK